MTCVSLTACRREQHEREHCAKCRVLTCRYALDADRTCWQCEAPGFYASTRPVVVRNPWTVVALEMGEAPSRAAGGRRSTGGVRRPAGHPEALGQQRAAQAGGRR